MDLNAFRKNFPNSLQYLLNLYQTLKKSIMKKSMKKFEGKEIKNVKAVKGGSNGKGTKKAIHQVVSGTNNIELL
jgi:hypothetical protein